MKLWQKIKNIKLSKKSLIISLSILLVLVTIITCFLLTNKNKANNSTYKKYKMDIDIQLVTGEKREDKNIVIEDDSINTKVRLNYINKDIYYYKDNMVYEESGRYKKIESDFSYKDVINIIKKVDLGSKIDDNESKIYNPLLSKDIINNLLATLHIEISVDEDMNAYVETDNKNNIKKFILHFGNIYDYDEINMIITFKELDHDYKINVPNIYEELIDEVSDKNLVIIFNDSH